MGIYIGFFKSKIIATPTAIILATTTTTLAIATLFNRVGEEEDENHLGESCLMLRSKTSKDKDSWFALV